MLRSVLLCLLISNLAPLRALADSPTPALRSPVLRPPTLRLVPFRTLTTAIEGRMVAVTPNSQQIVMGGFGMPDNNHAAQTPKEQIDLRGQIDLWDIGTGHLARRVGVPQGFMAAAYSWDGRLLATAYEGGEVRISAAHNGKTIRSIKTRAEMFSYLSFSPDGLTLAASTVQAGGCADGAGPLLLFDVRTGKARSPAYRGVFQGLNNLIGSFSRWFAVHPSMRQVVVCTEKGLIIRPAQGHGKWRTLQNSMGYNSVAVSRDGRLIAAMSVLDTDDLEANLAVWDFSTGKQIASIPKVLKCFGNAEIEFSPDSRYLIISGEGSNLVRILRVERP